MKLFRRAVAVVGTALLIAFAGSAPAFASTDLHQVPPIEATQSSECQPGDVADGFTLWHFVLTQTEATQSSITVTFGYPATTHQFLSSKNTGGVLHFNVVRPTGKVLLGAYTAADGDLLNLSHTCIGGTTSTPTPDPTPTPEPTPSPEPSATPTPTPSPTPSPVASPTPTSTPSPTPSPTPSAQPSPSPTPSATPSPVPSTEPLPSTTPVVPDMTLPPTDTEGNPPSSDGEAHPLGLIVIAGMTFVLAFRAIENWWSRQDRLP